MEEVAYGPVGSRIEPALCLYIHPSRDRNHVDAGRLKTKERETSLQVEGKIFGPTERRNCTEKDAQINPRPPGL